LKKVQQETAQIEQHINELQNEIDRLNNDPSYLEDIARKEYGLLKKNEKVYDFSKPISKKDK
jgi:cell division protein FtsB